MSEPMFPTATEEAPFAAPAEESGGSGGNRKALLAVGGVVAALVVGAGAFFLLTGSGGGEEEAWAPTVTPKSAAPAPSASASGGTTVVKVKPVAVVGHDPFAPLFAVQGNQSTTTGTGVSTTTGGSTGTSTSGGAVTTPVTTGGSTTASAVTLTVAGIDTVKQTATVTVDGKKYVTTVGTPFGSYYMMYSVFNDTCVGILAGDTSVAVCTTKPVTVTP